MENATQMMTLTEQQMLDLYKTMTHLNTARRDCTVERDDGIDLDTWLKLKLKQWYAQLLLTAPIDWLPIQDVSEDVTLSVNAYGVVRASVPPQCVRPVEWQLEGWCHSVTLFLKPQDPLVRLQLNPWTRGRRANPAVIEHTDHLTMYSISPGETPQLVKALCVVRPADGSYTFHSAALSSLPPLD